VPSAPTGAQNSARCPTLLNAIDFPLPSALREQMGDAVTRLSGWKSVCLVCMLLAAAADAVTAQTVTILAYYGDYFTRFSSFVQGRDGNLYGTMIDADFGHVVKITPSGTLTILYSFCPQSDCIAGKIPGPLVLATDGNFYGAALEGGIATGGCSTFGCGTLFKMTAGGALTILHTFSGSDGMNPDWLIEASDGNFYGTTSAGGSGGTGCGCGTIFKLTPAGVLTTLHSFDQTDGYGPSGLIQGTDGNLYGTTGGGGNFNRLFCPARGCGTVFKATTSGIFTSLHSFQVTDGALPDAPPVQASDGTFYGTTYEGPNGGDGTVFRITSQGQTKTVHYFTGLANYVAAGLFAASDGNLYGTTVGGPSCANVGVIYSIGQTGAFTTVYDSCQAGIYTNAVFQATSGKFYGAYRNSAGVVYSLDTGLGPFVTFVIPLGKPGQTVQILGQGLTGTTSVTFNGVGATKFSVVSDTYMTAVVPSGATTGAVVVTTPSGTLTSNKQFQIVP
jgi:uncharacterized repeat protein (TIGR03803 family)